MAKRKKRLKKAQRGLIGPQTKEDAMFYDAIDNTNIVPFRSIGDKNMTERDNDPKAREADYIFNNPRQRMEKGGMTGQDLNDIQKANENKNVMFSIMKDAYNKRNKKRGAATKMGMGGMCPPKVIQGKSLR